MSEYWDSHNQSKLLAPFIYLDFLLVLPQRGIIMCSKYEMISLCPMGKLRWLAVGHAVNIQGFPLWETPASKVSFKYCLKAPLIKEWTRYFTNRSLYHGQIHMFYSDQFRSASPILNKSFNNQMVALLKSSFLICLASSVNCSVSIFFPCLDVIISMPCKTLLWWESGGRGNAFSRNTRNGHDDL